jgi:hypothetical protein
VPTTAGGAAIFDLTAYPPGEAPAAGSGGGGGGANCCNPQTANSANLTADSDKPARLYLESYSENDSGSSSAVFSGSWPWTFNWVMTNSCYWTNNGGGGGSSWWKVQYGNDDGNGGFENVQDSGQMNDSASEWPTVAAGTDIRYNFIESTGWGDPYSSDTNNWTNTWSPRLVNEHCNVQLTVGTTAGWPYQWLGSYYPAVPENQGQYGRTADAVWKLQTGGKALPQQKNLFQLSGSATEILDKHAYASDGGTLYPNPTPNQPIQMQNVIIDGQPLGSDGNQWRLYADNTTNDVTPRVKNKDFYTFNVDKQKYEQYIQASPGGRLDPDTIHATNCVGQKIVFSLQFDPPLPDGILITNQNNWWLPSKYVNVQEWFQPDAGSVSNTANGTYYQTMCHPEQTFYSRSAYSIDSPYCTYYKQSSWPLNQPETGAWWISGGSKAVTCFPTLTFNNGQKVSLGSVQGDFYVDKPQASFDAGNANIGPVDVEPSGQTFPGAKMTSGDVVFSATIASAFSSGKVNWTQLINRHTSGDGLQFLDNLFFYDTFGNTELDNIQFYNTQNDLPETTDGNMPIHAGASINVPFSDRPSIGIASTSYLTIIDTFNTYLVFNPDPNNSDNIWVTLGRVDWGWNGYAAFDISNNKWVLVSGSTNVTTFIATDDFPVWTKVYHNSK